MERKRIIFLLPKGKEKNFSSSPDEEAHVWGGQRFSNKTPHCPTDIEKVE